MKTLRVLLIVISSVVAVAFFASSHQSAHNSTARLLVMTQPVQDKWKVAVVADAEQFKNPAVPVVVVSTISGTTDPNAVGKKQFVVKEVIVENRSTKKVSAITFRWAIAPMDNRLAVLRQGELLPHNLTELRKSLVAGSRQTLKLSHPKISRLIEETAGIESMGTNFALIIGVGEVTFEDGSVWKEVPTDVTKKSLTTN